MHEARSMADEVGQPSAAAPVPTGTGTRDLMLESARGAARAAPAGFISCPSAGSYELLCSVYFSLLILSCYCPGQSVESDAMSFFKMYLCVLKAEFQSSGESGIHKERERESFSTC